VLIAHPRHLPKAPLAQQVEERPGEHHREADVACQCRERVAVACRPSAPVADQGDHEQDRAREVDPCPDLITGRLVERLVLRGHGVVQQPEKAEHRQVAMSKGHPGRAKEQRTVVGDDCHGSSVKEE
jgi:hypothetical protein